MANYTYPHVELTQTAMRRRTPVVTESNATTLLAPFTCDRGPSNQLVAIDSYADFVDTFGTLDYKKEGHEQILNIGNWLANGGRVLACRIVPESSNYYLYVDDNIIDEEVENNTYITDSGATISGKCRKTKFVWKLNASDEAYLSETDYINVIYIPNYEFGGKKYIPELLIEHHYNDETDKTDSYYFALTNENVENGTGKHASLETNTDYYGIVNSGYGIKNLASLSDSLFTYTDGVMVHLRASIELYISSNSLVLTTLTDTSSFSTKININPIVKTAALAKKAEQKYDVLVGKNTISFRAIAKYEGSYYNNIDIVMAVSVIRNIPYFTITLQKTLNNKTESLERFSNLSIDELYKIETNSQYLESFKVFYNDEELTSKMIIDNTTISNYFIGLNGKTIPHITLQDGTDGETAIQSFLVEKLTEILNKPLETPFDVFIDPGYGLEVKKDLIKLFCNKSTDINDVVRNDAFLVLSEKEFTATGFGKNTLNTITTVDSSTLRPDNGNIDGVVCDFWNMAIFKYAHKIEDIYSLNGGREVYVPSTYFLTSLYPVNDRVSGVQYPSAGLTRGVITGSLWVSELPTNAQKQEYFNRHENYIEKDSRGIYFMTQLTGDVNDTALSEIGAARALIEIKKELSTTARRYLHEFNDRITKKNLENALNTIMSNWIQNRTLSYGTIQLTDSTENPTLLDTEIAIAVSLKFTNTIEVISFDITVGA